MQSVDWLWLLHPALAVVLVYPLLGMVLRLAQQTRDRRLTQAKHPPTVGRDHADLGKWLAGSVVAIVLLAEAVVIATKHALPSFEGGSSRLALMGMVLIGSGVALAALWRVKQPPYRASFALLCWAGVIGLGAAARGVPPQRQPPRSGFLAIAFLGRGWSHRPDAVLGGLPPGDPQTSALAAVARQRQRAGGRDLPGPGNQRAPGSARDSAQLAEACGRCL